MAGVNVAGDYFRHFLRPCAPDLVRTDRAQPYRSTFLNVAVERDNRAVRASYTFNRYCIRPILASSYTRPCAPVFQQSRLHLRLQGVPVNPVFILPLTTLMFRGVGEFPIGDKRSLYCGVRPMHLRHPKASDCQLRWWRSPLACSPCAAFGLIHA